MSRTYALVCTHCYVLPKGKIYIQLVLDCITGVVASMGSESAELAPYKQRPCRGRKRRLEAVVRGAPPTNQQLSEW